MNIWEKIIEFVFGLEEFNKCLDRDFIDSYDPNISFEELMKKYQETINE